MANTKVIPSKIKKSKTFSIEKRVYEDFMALTNKQGLVASRVVNRMIKDYLKKHIIDD